MFINKPIKTFALEDLVGRTLTIQSFTGAETDLIMAKDIKTGDLFVLQAVEHPINEESHE